LALSYAENNQEPELAWSPNSHCLALDGVRGLAILTVTLYRLCKELDPNIHPAIAMVRRFAPIGERGVDLFFVLSGFLITGILLRSKGKPNYFRNFIARRSLRIFPLYFLSLIVGLWIIPNVVATSVFDLPRSEQFYLWTYTSNLRMSWLNEWCFGPFDHFWSLAVEEHFYFVWPAVVLMLASKRLIGVCVGTIVVVAIARTLAAINSDFDVAVDVLTLFRADALCMGALLAVLLNDSVKQTAVKNVSVVLALVLLPILLAVAFTEKRLLGIPNTLCPMFLIAGMAIVLLSSKTSVLVKSFESPFLRFLGKYSYGMYVVQLPLVTLMPLTAWFGLLPSNPLVQSLLYVVGMFGLIATIAVLSFHCVERPFLRIKQRFE
jgi:peptidoglycan/LPS O-acetylase OafA/YrhL